jgi:hypothetical protein
MKTARRFSRFETLMSRLLLVALLSCAMITGCAVPQAHRDQDQMRTALLDLYTNQVMDNLIRAYNRMPIIQLDYTQAQGMITVKNTANVSNMETWATGVTSVLNAGLGLENTNQITISAVPVTTSNEVYDAYLQFLSIQDSLVATADPPPAGAAHICRKCGDMYYWVPVWCRDRFFELALLSTAQRGKSLLPADQFYSANVIDVIGNPVPTEFDPNAVVITLKLDKKIPNDDGYLIFNDPKAGGSTPPGSPSADTPPQYPFDKYRSDANDPSKPQVPPLALTDRIEISYDKAKLESLKSQLPVAPVAVRVRLHHSQPSPPTTEDLLQRANFQLQQFNQNIVRQAG